MSVKYLLVSIKTGTLVLAIQKIDFGRIYLGGARGEEVASSGGFRGGWGGCIPPTSPKVTILAKKSASISNNLAPFRDASPPPAAT